MHGVSLRNNATLNTALSQGAARSQVWAHQAPWSISWSRTPGPQCMALTPNLTLSTRAPGALVNLLVQRAQGPVHGVNPKSNPKHGRTRRPGQSPGSARPRSSAWHLIPHLIPALGAPGALVDLLVQRAGTPVHGAQEEPKVHRGRKPPLQHLARPLRVTHCSYPNIALSQGVGLGIQVECQ